MSADQLCLVIQTTKLKTRGDPTLTANYGTQYLFAFALVVFKLCSTNEADWLE